MVPPLSFWAKIKHYFNTFFNIYIREFREKGVKLWLMQINFLSNF